MNIITKGIVHPNEEGTQFLIISPIRHKFRTQVMDLFDVDYLMKLCKNEGEQDQIKEFPISVTEIGLNRIVCLGAHSIEGYELLSWIQNRFYIIRHRTDYLPLIQELFIESTGIITRYNDDNLLVGDIEQLKMMINDFVQTKN